jgi:Mor family transcriptional regulator
VQVLLARLYAFQPIPTKPLSKATPEEEERNAEIWARYAAGMSVPALARKYCVTKTRIYQILKVFRQRGFLRGDLNKGT